MKRTGVLPTHPTTERQAISVIVDQVSQRKIRADLFHLADYKVSTVSGPVLWLVPFRCPVCDNIGTGAGAHAEHTYGKGCILDRDPK